jgi:ribosomal protein L11 methyltransferase
VNAVLRVAVRVPLDQAEQARARLLALVPGGFEEVDVGSDLELAAYVDEAGEAALRAVFPGARATAVEPGWEDSWRRFHRPLEAGGVWIGPPWEVPPRDIPAVLVEPGRAFGTGAHPTTRLCIEHLARLERGSLLDVGCGSGVVALAASRLGYGPLIAVDSDPVAVECARDNAARNGIALETALVDALVDELPAARVAVVNILRPAVENVLASLDVAVAVTSGYLVGEAPATPGWRRIARLERDGWAADAFARARPQ